MFNTASMKFDHFENDGLAVFKEEAPVAPIIILEQPHQTPNGMFRAVVWNSAEFTCEDIVEACTFTEAAVLAAEMHPTAELTDAAKEQLLVEELVLS